MTYITAQVLPFIPYFILITWQEPHDCFECFNRLSIRYSIFQYTQEERNIYREHQVGQGAIERHANLVHRETEKEN